MHAKFYWWQSYYVGTALCKTETRDKLNTGLQLNLSKHSGQELLVFFILSNMTKSRRQSAILRPSVLQHSCNLLQAVLTFASKHTPCLNTSSLCTGSLRSCASSTRLYLVTPGIAASVPAPLPLNPGVPPRALPRLLPPRAPPPRTPTAATPQAPRAAGNTSPGGHPGRGATAAAFGCFQLRGRRLLLLSA